MLHVNAEPAAPDTNDADRPMAQGGGGRLTKTPGGDVRRGRRLHAVSGCSGIRTGRGITTNTGIQEETERALRGIA